MSAESAESTAAGPAASPADDAIVGRLVHAVAGSDFSWSLCLIGEDQSNKLATLTADLRGRFSETGDGKQITSGFSYWGITPTVAWARACSDPFYLVMKQSIESFGRRWRRVSPQVLGKPYHYVSLGPGNGQKDRTVLRDLHATKPDMFYVPVDMSAEMLRLGVAETQKSVRLQRHQVLPVQLDFNIEDNLDEFKELLERGVGDEPVLFSLLGNTMANFEDDTGLLHKLVGLLRPQDRFMVEVATTEEITDDSARAAGEEYSRSSAFREFVTSALLAYTDLTVDTDDVELDTAVDGDRGLTIKVLYRNRTGSDIQVILPDRSTMLFPQRDTIRLYMTRKYARDGLPALFHEVGLAQVSGTHSDLTFRSPTGFGMDLALLRLDTTVAGDQRSLSRQNSRGDDPWGGYQT